MLKKLPKKTNIRVAKTADIEEVLPEEEAAIEEGRRAYADGAWVSLSKTKNGMGRSHYQTRAKKS